MSDKKSSGRGRTRNFATVVYPESAPTNWQEVLSEHHVLAFISPLHDKDINPDDTPKKPHFHVLVMFEGVKTDEQVKELFATIGGVGLERVNTLRGYARYLCHLDNPEKHQYSPDDVRSFCGANYIEVIGLATDKYQAIYEMVDFCEENDIISYKELFLYARLHRNDWSRVLCDNGTYVIKEYVKSRAWEKEEARRELERERYQ